MVMEEDIEEEMTITDAQWVLNVEATIDMAVALIRDHSEALQGVMIQEEMEEVLLKDIITQAAEEEAIIAMIEDDDSFFN